MDSPPRGCTYWYIVRAGHGITRDHEPESTENHRADQQYQDVCPAVYRRIVYGRDGTLSFPNRKTTYGSSQIGQAMALVSLSMGMTQTGIVMFKSFAPSNKTGRLIS